MEIQRVLMTQIRRNEGQHRKHFDPDKLRELADSIRAEGLQQPIILRPLSEEERSSGREAYAIVAGERRWRAHRILNRRHIPAIVNEGLSAHRAKAIELLENIQRAEVSPVEEGHGYRDFVASLVTGHHTTREKALATCARKIGKGLPVVRARIRLAHLPEELQEAVNRHHRREAGGLKVTDADSLARLLFAVPEDVFTALEGDDLAARLREVDALGRKALAGRLTGRALATACQAVAQQQALSFELAAAESRETLDASRKVAEAIAEASRAVGRLRDIDPEALTHSTLRRNLGRLGAVKRAVSGIEKAFQSRDADLTAAQAAEAA